MYRTRRRAGGLPRVGVGVALATGCGVAAADAGSSGSSSSSAGKPATSNPAHSSAKSQGSSAGKQASKGSAPSATATSASVEASSTPALNNVDAQTLSTASAKRNSRATTALTDLPSSTPTPENSNPRTTKQFGVTPGPIAAALSALSAVATSQTPASASTASVVSTPPSLTSAPTLQSVPSLTAAAAAAMTKTMRPIVLDALTLSATIVADYRPIPAVVNIVTFAAPSPTTANPTLVSMATRWFPVPPKPSPRSMESGRIRRVIRP